MNTIHAGSFFGLLIGFTLIAAPSATQAQSSERIKNSYPAVSQIPVYQPPLRGAPATRVGGASRGEQHNELVLSVLAPESTGLTSRAQPTLYWYSSQSLAGPLEFTLIDDHSIEPLMEVKVSVSQPGIHALRLNYTLKPEVEYQWAIAAVTDPNQRASDVVASGTIQRIQPPATLAVRLDNASKPQLPFLYAEAGFWYDAIATLSEQIDASPTDRVLREQRAALLEQVGLTVVATHDRAGY
jgi:hypothetical protein